MGHTEETRLKISEQVNRFNRQCGIESRRCASCLKKIRKHNKSGFCLSCKPKLPDEKKKVMSSSYMAAYQLKRKLFLIEYKGGKCIRCGYNKYSGALEFHHRSSNEKEFNLSQFRNRALDICIKEVDKCDLLCANCHREVEHEILLEV